MTTPSQAGPAPKLKMWILYDGRAAGGVGTDHAAVLCCADSLIEALHDKRQSFPDAEIYEYDVRGDQLLNERWVPHVK